MNLFIQRTSKIWYFGVNVLYFPFIFMKINERWTWVLKNIMHQSTYPHSYNRLETGYTCVKFDLMVLKQVLTCDLNGVTAPIQSRFPYQLKWLWSGISLCKNWLYGFEAIFRRFFDWLMSQITYSWDFLDKMTYVLHVCESRNLCETC